MIRLFDRKYESAGFVYLAPLSKKSFASLIFAAMYGEPPERRGENERLEVEWLTSIGMIENDQTFIGITDTDFISGWTKESN